ncbi:MAG: hypothetical protein EOP53_15025 [Sphingobacteriales bacterium]|nr:MAG: hypothetical protein EOP53_15025 [Sphingobacteriales bacterium]
MISKDLIRFVQQFVLYILLLAGLASYPLYKYGDGVIIEGLIANLSLFFFVTIASVAFILRPNVPKDGILNSFMITMVVKMLIALAYFMLVLKSFSGHEIQFALTFFAAYLVCTAFEVYYILHNLRQI